MKIKIRKPPKYNCLGGFLCSLNSDREYDNKLKHYSVMTLCD
ncbi:hypothetical protein MPR_0407 [Myroides profundi]|nr:hypothetical protein MPR_0407 [Myroides profundi]